MEGHSVRPSAGKPVPLSNQVRWVRLRVWSGAAQGRASAGARSPAGPCRYALLLYVVIFLYTLNRDISKYKYAEGRMYSKQTK